MCASLSTIKMFYEFPLLKGGKGERGERGYPGGVGPAGPPGPPGRGYYGGGDIVPGSGSLGGERVSNRETKLGQCISFSHFTVSFTLD